MAMIVINPAYRDLLAAHGLTTPERVLAVPNVIVSGHPDRHVARLELADLTVFLKREHRVRWKDRLANVWAGFGWVSKSVREARVLRQARQAGLGCPEWLAVGEDKHGRAFLLLRELAGFVDLPTWLHERRSGPTRQRRRLAHRLGAAVGQLHEAGFDHPDLYAKHVLIHSATGRISFLDWQRSGRRNGLCWRDRWRDLAALDATLADDLAPRRDRLVFLAGYLRQVLGPGICGSRRPLLRQAARHILLQSARLQRQRRIRELRHAARSSEPPRLIWLKGEELCATPECCRQLGSEPPSWLDLAKPSLEPPRELERRRLTLADGTPALLVRRRLSQPLRWLRQLLRGRSLVAPEVQQAGLLFRLQRCGIAAPRLLAFGQRRPRPWVTESLLLTEWHDRAVTVHDYFRRHGGRQRQLLLRTVAQLLRDLHRFGCYLRPGPGGLAALPFRVLAEPAEPLRVVLDEVSALHTQRRPNDARAWRDLQALHRAIPTSDLSRTQRLRFLLGYLGVQRLTAQTKAGIRRHLRSRPPQERKAVHA